ncbi:MAG: ABC transporter ATP-binding protein [Myxococcales bacterium]|nr:ABC transporter ATP-binding protein [Myxococcales bacterium]
MVFIELENVQKIYGAGQAQVAALRDVTLSISTGEFVSIMGPSGSGKSTLLNLVSALDVPTSGSIRIDSVDIGTLSDDELTLFRRNKIGLVFQFFNLLPTLDAFANVLLPIQLSRRANQEDKDRTKEILREVGLEKRIHHKTTQLSGGEMQRVAIARALVQNPKLLLADEPTGNLDTKTGRDILQLLRSTCDRRGMTVVMVTHDRQAANWGHRLIQLQDGAILGTETIDPQHRL